MDQPKKEFTSADLAAVEQSSQQVSQEQIIAAALFAKQLQADLVGIKKAQVGDGLKVPDVDMSKVMPSEIYKTFRPVGGPNQPVRSVFTPPTQVASAQIPDIVSPPIPVQSSFVTTAQIDNNQLELDFNRTAKYEDVVEAIEKLEKKINQINDKLDLFLQDGKKKLKQTLTKNGPQAG